MTKPGFVYALINVSMPGLVKVGQTSRDPEERAKELSAATGVPTPFIVVYQEFFADCEEAERRTHTILDSKGYRSSPDREFFLVPLKDVISILIQLQAEAPALSQLHSVTTPATDTKHLARELLSRAKDSSIGRGDVLKDYSEAYRLYQDAARLGAGEAYLVLSHFEVCGFGRPKNLERAMEWLRRGVQAGVVDCYPDMAWLFSNSEGRSGMSSVDSIENARKCWRTYCEIALQHRDDWDSSEALFVSHLLAGVIYSRLDEYVRFLAEFRNAEARDRHLICALAGSLLSLDEADAHCVDTADYRYMRTKLEEIIRANDPVAPNTADPLRADDTVATSAVDPIRTDAAVAMNTAAPLRAADPVATNAATALRAAGSVAMNTAAPCSDRTHAYPGSTTDITSAVRKIARRLLGRLS